jgi:hypothetical protein
MAIILRQPGTGGLFFLPHLCPGRIGFGPYVIRSRFCDPLERHSLTDPSDGFKLHQLPLLKSYALREKSMHKKTKTIESKMAKDDPAKFELDLNYLGEIGSSSFFSAAGCFWRPRYLN